MWKWLRSNYEARSNEVVRLFDSEVKDTILIICEDENFYDIAYQFSQKMCFWILSIKTVVFLQRSRGDIRSINSE